MKKTSRKIISNQNGIHDDLQKILTRHRETSFQKPVAEHTLRAFAYIQTVIAKRRKPLILDSGCGTGESTILLAQMHPEHFVIGVDKSLARLSKNPSFNPLLEGRVLSLSKGAGVGQSLPRKSGVDQNFLLIRADLIDFWRLAAKYRWQVEKHYLLYPNPWPKKNQIKRRFHGHPVFFDFIKLGRFFELRSNWDIYLQEFAAAFAFTTGVHSKVEKFFPNTPFISKFEKKYAGSGHTLYRLVIDRKE